MVSVSSGRTRMRIGSFYRSGQSPPVHPCIICIWTTADSSEALHERDQGHLEATELFCIDATAATVTS
jgi:hypothetical protein